MTSDEYNESRYKVLRARADRERAATAGNDGRIGDAAKQVVASIRTDGLSAGTRRVVKDAMGKVVRRIASQSKLKLSKLRAKETEADTSNS